MARKSIFAGLRIYTMIGSGALSLLLILLGEVAQPQTTDTIELSTPRNLTPTPSYLRIQIDLSDRRLTVFYGDKQARSYPVAVGREGWRTPTGTFEVQQIIFDPAWVNPFNGAVIPGGNARNPLGRHWIGFWTDGHNWIGMHGTPNRDSVGQAASHGCIRLLNEDIQELFGLVQMGTPVTVVP